MISNPETYSGNYTPDEVVEINDDLMHWAAMEHNRWRVSAFTGERSCTFVRKALNEAGAEIGTESVFITKDIVNFFKESQNYYDESRASE